jgi:hypothetical protein
MEATDESVRRSARVLAGFVSDEEAVGFANCFAIDGEAFVTARQSNVTKRSNLPQSCVAPRVEDMSAAALSGGR